MVKKVVYWKKKSFVIICLSINSLNRFILTIQELNKEIKNIKFFLKYFENIKSNEIHVLVHFKVNTGVLKCQGAHFVPLDPEWSIH